MSSVTTIPDHILQVLCFILQAAILWFVFYIPVAKRLLMLRVYLTFSLARATFLVVVARHASIAEYYRFHSLLQIIGHVFLMLMAVELMVILISDDRSVNVVFYAMAVAFMIVLAVGMIHFPTTQEELAIFMQKALALALFILAFVSLLHPKHYWPYSGLAFGLTVMLSLDFGCVLLQQLSMRHGGVLYRVVRYAYPLASLTGYLLWFRAIFVHHEKPPKPLMSPEKIAEWREQLMGYKAAIKDSIKKRTAQ